jgi:hypothetical protein
MSSLDAFANTKNSLSPIEVLLLDELDDVLGHRSTKRHRNLRVEALERRKVLFHHFLEDDFDHVSLERVFRLQSIGILESHLLFDHSADKQLPVPSVDDKLTQKTRIHLYSELFRATKFMPNHNSLPQVTL